MLKKMSNSVYSSAIPAGLPSIVHGYSTRHVRDTKKNSKNRTRFLQTVGVSSDTFVAPEQIHANDVVLVERYENVSVIPEVDGIVLSEGASSEDITLCTFAADCVPLLFVDPYAHI